MQVALSSQALQPIAAVSSTTPRRLRRTALCPPQATYRWSADGDRDGRRKRESIFDNAEPETTTSGRGASTGADAEAGRWNEAGGEAWEQLDTPRGPSGGDRDGGGTREPSGEAGAWSEWGSAPPGPAEDDWGWATEPGRAVAGQQGSTDERQQRRRQQSGGGDDAEPWEEDEWSGPSGRGAERGAQRGEEGKEEGGEQYSESYGPEFVPPDIALLSPEETERLLPWTPCAGQAAYFAGGAGDVVQRWGASLAATIVLSKVAALAATTLTWPLWWPWALAFNRNRSLRASLPHAGLWRTRVLAVEVTGRPRPNFGSQQRGGGFTAAKAVNVSVGDPGGAQAEVSLPYDSRYEMVRPGEPAELLVLSSLPGFETFKAVKDVYLPNSGLWLSEYPYCDRAEFLELSLQVEREAQEEAAAGGSSGTDAYGPRSESYEP